MVYLATTILLRFHIYHANKARSRSGRESSRKEPPPYSFRRRYILLRLIVKL